MKILVCEGNLKNAKTYPFWEQLYPMLGQHEVKKIEGMLPEQAIMDLVNWCDIWISIDSFLQHLVAYKGLKRGIVLWGTSDPALFGYPTNINLVKSMGYMRPDQFFWWKDAPNTPDAFVSPQMVVAAIKSMVQY